MPIEILKTTGEVVGVVDEGESCNVVAAFHFNGTAIVKANLATMLVTLYDKSTNAKINSRLNQDVYDTNNGTIATDGTITLRLGPLDNIIVGASVAEEAKEQHIIRFIWTWSDGVATRTGKEELEFSVQKLRAVT